LIRTDLSLNGRNPSYVTEIGDLYIPPGARVILDHKLKEGVLFLAYASVHAIIKLGPTDKKLAIFSNLKMFDPPKIRANNINLLLESTPKYNDNDPVRSITKEIFEKIIQEGNNKTDNISTGDNEQKQNFLLLGFNQKDHLQRPNNDHDDNAITKTYFFKKGVSNFTKIQKGARTIWFDAKDNSIYFWSSGEIQFLGHGVVQDVHESGADLEAIFNDFNFFWGEPYNINLQVKSDIQREIKELNGWVPWSPYNSIIEIDKQLYEKILSYHGVLNTLGTGFPDSSKNSNRLFGKFFLLGVSKNDKWQFFNPQIRNWDFLRIIPLPKPPYSDSLIVRDGWIVRKIARNRYPFYYKAKNDQMLPISYSDADDLLSKHSTDIVEVNIRRTGRYLVLDTYSIYLPEKIFKELMDLGIKSPIDNEELFIPIQMFPKLKHLFDSSNLRMKIITANESKETSTRLTGRLNNKISDILVPIYNSYLNKESDIELLINIFVTRNFDKLDPTVKEHLSFVTKSNGKTAEEEALEKFLTTKVVSFFDWRDMFDLAYEHSLAGLIISSISKEYAGKWTNNYFKIVIPELERIVHLQTTLAPNESLGEVDPSNVKLSQVILNKWRIYPYIGKIKNTGTREETKFDPHAPREFIDSSFTSIVGVPSIEHLLRDLCYLDSFTLDLGIWRGSYNLSRYFIALVKVIDPLDQAAKFPCITVKDFFGNTFRIVWDLQVYFDNAHIIKEIRQGECIELLLENKLDNTSNSKYGIDFETVYGSSFQIVKEFEFIRMNILALLKYLSYVKQDSLVKFLSLFHATNLIQSAIGSLLKDNLAVGNSDCVYYRYKCLSPSNMCDLLQGMRKPDGTIEEGVRHKKYYVLWSLMLESLSAIHPLAYADSVYTDTTELTNNKEAYSLIRNFCDEVRNEHIHSQELRRRERNILLQSRNRGQLKFRGLVIRSETDDNIYEESASRMVMNFGKLSIIAHGEFIEKAHRIARKILWKFAYKEASITRNDRTVVDNQGRRRREAEFIIQI
jgi:hypothetical protein